MKTREQAEARARELFPSSMNLDRIMEISACRKAFLKCWDEMQQEKKVESKRENK